MARRRADACYRELGAELRKRRIAANLTMRELAYHLDWSPSTVSRVESGYIGLPTTEVLLPPRSSRAIRFRAPAPTRSARAGGNRGHQVGVGRPRSEAGRASGAGAGEPTG